MGKNMFETNEYIRDWNILYIYVIYISKEQYNKEI